MKKFINFFIKHKKIFIIVSIIVILTAVSLTAVTIALWNKEEEHTEIVNEPTNPAIKYLDYYVVIENASSECGFDYYPTTRVPSEFKDRIVGLAVARYDGFASTVEIPQKATVDLKVDSTTYQNQTYNVIHILANYSEIIGNGFSGETNFVTSIVLPETITYVHKGAFDKDDTIYVKGKITYNHLITTKENEITITTTNNGENKIVDRLVKRDNYYLSTSTYIRHSYDGNNISYNSPLASINGKISNKINSLKTIYGLDKSTYPNLTFEDENNRKNNLTYSLTKNDLFGRRSGAMISDWVTGEYINVFAGKTFTGSDEALTDIYNDKPTDHGYQKLTDGITGGRFSTKVLAKNATPSATRDTLITFDATIDLGGRYNLSTLKLYAYSQSGMETALFCGADLKVEAFVNGKWIEVAGYNQDTIAIEKTGSYNIISLDLGNVIATHVRLYSSDAAANGYSLTFYEAECYGKEVTSSNYHRYIVTKEATTITIAGKTASLAANSKYYVTYNGSSINATKVTYKVGNNVLNLDTSNTNYESYYIDVEGKNINVDEYYGNVKKQTFNLTNELDGKVELTFAPDTLFTDLKEKTLYSFNEIYYLHNVTESNTTTTDTYSVTVNSTANKTTIFTAEGYIDANKKIDGKVNTYSNAFVLSDTSLTYYVDNGTTNSKLVYYNGLYYANIGNSGVVKILGYKNGEEVYVSPSFSYVSGKKYDLTKNGTPNTLDVTSLDINQNYFIIKSPIALSYITINATYTDYLNTNTVSGRVTLQLSAGTNFEYKVSSSDIEKINSILANANIFSNEYRFDSYKITTDTGMVLYEYTYDSENGRLPEFYQKQYEIFRLDTTNIVANVFFDYLKLKDGSTTFKVENNTLTATKTSNKYDYVVNSSNRMKRNFANTSFKEYYGSVSNGKSYIVNKLSNSVSLVDKLAFDKFSSSTLLYKPDGYSTVKYDLYTLDGIYIDTLVYQDGLLYTNIFDMNSYYGYYVVDSTGKAYNSYTDYSGYFEQLYDYYLVSNDLSLLNVLNGYGLLKDSNSNYIIKNVNLKAGTYHINNGVDNVTTVVVDSDGYYDINYNLTNVTINPSNKVENLNASVTVNTTPYTLYPTNNSSIYSTFVTVTANSSSVKVFDTNGDLVTTLTLDKGTYRVYVNLSDYSVNGYYGWKDRVYVSEAAASNNDGTAISKVIKLNPYDNYLVVDNDKTKVDITSTMDHVPNSYKLQTSSYTVNGVKMSLAGKNYYEAIVKVNNSLTLDNTTISNLIPGTYQVYYDGSKLTCNRVEGSKQFTITINNNTYNMILNTSTTLYEEYKLEGSYSISDNYNIVVTDDMGNIYESKLPGGLYTALTFSIDNARRYNNAYDIFVNLNGVTSTSNKVTLHDGNKTIIYYYSNSNTSLPKYDDFFTASKGKVFSHWSTTAGGSKVSNLSSKPANLYAVMVDETKEYTVNSGDGFHITNTNGETVTSFEYVAGTTIQFKVVVDKPGYTVSSVSVGKTTLTANAGVYSFNCNDVVLPASINVVLKYPQTQYKTAKITLNANGGSLSKTSVDYQVATYAQLPVPSRSGYTFLYYYDTNTGIVYTDSNGNLLSPYLITKNITLTACYTDTYYVIVNSYNADGTLKGSTSQQVKEGNLHTANFPREDGHYSEITSVKTTSGYPVEFSISEYEHLYSFTMPNANVIINIKYKTDETINKVTNQSHTIYVLIPSSFANDVGVYTGSSYTSMSRLDSEYQIYPGFVAYTYNKFNCNKLKIKANGDYSYAYPYDGSNNLYIIDNFSLENEILYQYNWIKYTQIDNVFTLTNYVVDNNNVKVNAIHGKVNVSGSTISIDKAISCDDDHYYQYAAFEVVVTNTDSPIKISFMVYYYADGTNNPILINSSDDFNHYIGNGSIKYQSGLSFKQTADIEVADANGYNVVFNEKYPFNHTYDGDSNTITYLQKSFRTNKNNGLFGYIGSSGVVEKLTLDYSIDSTNYEDGHDSKYYIGSVAGVNNGTISNVTTSEKTILGYNLRYVGGIVGQNNGIISDCINNIKFEIKNYGVSDSYLIGGITGYNTNKALNCTSNTTHSVINESGRSEYANQKNGLSVSKTMPITFVDDWYFTSEEKSVGNQIYHFTSAAKVTYYNGTTELDSIVYDINQVYQYDYMNTIDIALITKKIGNVEYKTDKIVVSRVMLITNDAEGYERFYYSYNEEDGFVKLLDENGKPYAEYAGYPGETYSVTLTDLSSHAYITVNKVLPVYATKDAVMLDATLDLGGTYTLSTMRIYYFNNVNYAGKDFKVYVYANGNWSLAASCNQSNVASLVENNYIKLNLGNVNATKVRIYSSSPKPSYSISLNEIQCYDSSNKNVFNGKEFIPTEKALNATYSDYPYSKLTDNNFSTAANTGRFSSYINNYALSTLNSLTVSSYLNVTGCNYNFRVKYYNGEIKDSNLVGVRSYSPGEPVALYSNTTWMVFQKVVEGSITTITTIDPSAYSSETSINLGGTSDTIFDSSAEKITDLSSYNQTFTLANHTDFYTNYTTRVYFITPSKTYYYDFTSANINLPYFDDITSLYITRVKDGSEYNGFSVSQVYKDKIVKITKPTSGTYTTSWTPDSYTINLNVADNVMMWNSYYVVVKGNYYLMEKTDNRSFTATIYEDYSASDIVLSSNPDLDDVCQMTLTYRSDNSYTISSTNSTYYLYGSINNYVKNDTNYKMYKYEYESNKFKHYGFLDLSEQATVKISGTSHEFKLGAGLHMIVYDGTNYVVYSDKQAFSVCFVSGDDNVYYGYSLGSSVKSPSLNPTMAETDKYTFEFSGWNYNGKLYTARNGLLYDDSGHALKVADNITLYAAFTSKIKQYTLSIINIVNGDEHPLKNIKYNCGTSISVSSLKSSTYQLNNSGLTDIWFVDWYIDRECTIKLVDRLVVNDDITIYALWSKNGAYLVGTLEGYTNETAREEYALEHVTSNGTTDYQIEKVFLEAGDYVKVLYHISENLDFVKKWTINISDSKICSASSDKLTINRTGYYSFYFDEGTMTVTVEFIEYVLHYDGNGYETTYDDYYFDATDANPFEIHTIYDRTVDMSAEINSPDIIGLESTKVLFGWYTEPSGGSRVTNITPSMTDYKNSITLYAQYKTKGYYINGLTNAKRYTNTNSTFEFNSAKY